MTGPHAQMPSGPTLVDGPAGAGQLLLLAHGAGAPMDSPFMEGIARRLADRGHRVVRFEFPYMAARRDGDRRPPPDREPKLRQAFGDAVAAVRAEHPEAALFIGGKSMGGRIASMIADETAALAGVVCLGYPFHPAGRPETLRTGHLQTLNAPCLIVQGTRDALGRPEEVAGYALSDRIRVHWIEGGDHSLEPLKRSGRTGADCLDEAGEAVSRFLSSPGPDPAGG